MGADRQGMKARPIMLDFCSIYAFEQSSKNYPLAMLNITSARDYCSYATVQIKI